MGETHTLRFAVQRIGSVSFHGSRRVGPGIPMVQSTATGQGDHAGICTGLTVDGSSTRAVLVEREGGGRRHIEAMVVDPSKRMFAHRLRRHANRAEPSARMALSRRRARREGTSSPFLVLP